MIEAKAASWKKDRVGELADLLKQDGVLAIVDVAGVPATAMLGMRDDLRSIMTMTMAKKSLIRLAWIEAGLDADSLETLFGGAVQPVLVHSDSLSAFKLFSELEKTRTGRAAKEGDVAPEDIIVEAGPTEFAPGPIVGELSAVGIPAKIDKGKVMIQKTVTAVKKGDVVGGDLGLMLDKLDIKPIEIGIILCGAIQDGIVMPPEDLDLDLEGFSNNISQAVSASFNVACNIRWFTPETVGPLLSKASGEAIAVAVEANISNSETIPLFIALANARALALAGQLDSSALDEELSGLLGAAASVASTEEATSDSSEEAEDAPEEESAEEEEAAEFDGLGDLFG